MCNPNAWKTSSHGSKTIYNAVNTTAKIDSADIDSPDVGYTKTGKSDADPRESWDEISIGRNEKYLQKSSTKKG